MCTFYFTIYIFYNSTDLLFTARLVLHLLFIQQLLKNQASFQDCCECQCVVSVFCVSALSVFCECQCAVSQCCFGCGDWALDHSGVTWHLLDEMLPGITQMISSVFFPVIFLWVVQSYFLLKYTWLAWIQSIIFSFGFKHFFLTHINLVHFGYFCEEEADKWTGSRPLSERGWLGCGGHCARRSCESLCKFRVHHSRLIITIFQKDERAKVQKKKKNFNQFSSLPQIKVPGAL